MTSDAVRPGSDAVRTDAHDAAPSAAPTRPPEEILLGFARALRAAGVAVTADRERTFLEAVAALGLQDQGGVYHAGRATLCGSPADLERYDLVFHAWFSGQRAGMKNRPPLQQVTSQAGLNDTAGASNAAQDDPDTVADLPLAIHLAQLAWRLVPGFGDGNLASLMGSFEMARPGGTRARAEAYFDEALRLGQGRSAGAFVAKAEGIAQPAGDKAAFLDLLNQAVAVTDAPGSPLALSNEVMRRRARWLIESADDLF